MVLVSVFLATLKMHQKKEKGSDSSDAIISLLPVLEMADCGSAEAIVKLINEHLDDAKDSRSVNGIVDFYITKESNRTLDILIRLKDPHDKHLFDKISELMKNEGYRYKSLQLLMNIVYRQPPWLYRIANHRIMNNLLNLLKTDQNAQNLLSCLFILISLLPVIPSQFGPFLNDTFEIFSKISFMGLKSQ
ncbi:uncharacterized protein CEXT_728491, partial [Caerostris extrusa]